MSRLCAGFNTGVLAELHTRLEIALDQHFVARPLSVKERRQHPGRSVPSAR